MEDVLQHVRRLEDRLGHLLAAGWQSSAVEAAALRDEAAALESAGLPDLALRLQAVADAGQVQAALPAIALATVHCRLLRLRLEEDHLPPGNWRPLDAGKPTAPRTARLLPVSRIALDQDEVWACVRLRGTLPEELVLVQPPAVSGEGAAWLRRPLEGRLTWQARRPLGATLDVQVCLLDNPVWLEPLDKAEEDPLAAFRTMLSDGQIKEGAMAFRHGGPLRLRTLEAADLPGLAWSSPLTLDLVRAESHDAVTALVWEQGAVATPLALLRPGGFLRRARIVHLVPGLPSDAFSRA